MRKSIIFIVLLIIFCSYRIQKQITWLALGDSITYLNDHPDETGNRVSKGYLTRITERLNNISYINQGHNSWTVIRTANEIEKLGLQKADVYTLFLGTNDWWSGQVLGTLDDYKNNTGNRTVSGAYRTIINKLKALNPQAPIILITPMQRADFVYILNHKNNAWGSYKSKNNQSLEQFADMVVQIGEYEHLTVIDLYHNNRLGLKKAVRFKRLKDPETGQYKNFSFPDYINVPYNPATDEYPYPPEAIGITYEGLHPSDKGNEIIARQVSKAIKKVVRLN